MSHIPARPQARVSPIPAGAETTLRDPIAPWDADPALVRPDYTGGGLINLMSSIAVALGGTSPYPPATVLRPQDLSGAHHLVLWVVDGLGYDFLRARDGTLRRHLLGPLTSVFPSTTASAIPTLLTGLAPQQHGLTGWTLYFREIGAIAAPLPFRTRSGHHDLRGAGVTPGGLFGLTPLFDRVTRRAHIVSPRQIVDSAFSVALTGKATRHGYESLDEMVAIIARLLRTPSGQRYIYAYWPRIDTLAHAFGIGSAPVAEAFTALDAAFERLSDVAQQTGSRVLATADHGFIDAGETIDLDDHPALRETLLLPLCGEARVAYAYVRSGQASRFEDYVRTHLADRIDLYRSSDLLRQGWLGSGTPHPGLSGRLGDFVLLPRGRTILRDWLQGEARYTHAGVHGGLSAAEMMVPLVVSPG